MKTAFPIWNSGALESVFTIAGSNHATWEKQGALGRRNTMSSNVATLDPREQIRFNRLMEGSYRKVFNMAYRLAGNRSDAEDLTQEAYYRAYRSFGDYEGDRPFENWIFRIVTRLFLDLLRSRRRRIKAVSYDSPLQRDGVEDNLYFEMPDDRPSPEDHLLSNSLGENLQRTLKSLTAEQRLLVILADVEGLPYKDIAEMMGKPVGTIRSRLHRTHKLMRQRLEKLQRERSGSVSGLAAVHMGG